MDEVFVVVAGKYDDFHLVKIFHNKKSANKFVREFNTKIRLEDDAAWVETWLVND